MATPDTVGVDAGHDYTRPSEADADSNTDVTKDVSLELTDSAPDAPGGCLRDSKDKQKERRPSAFDRLPDEIIEQILQTVDSNGFASLALLNTKWRSVAQQAHLYAHHLARCPSYAMAHKGSLKASGEDLPRLRRLFAREVKRNLFEAYLRPSRTVIRVISNSISSSSCPGGEGIQFSASPRGHHLLAYNSSRIHVIDARTEEITVKREFKIARRPAATCINDEGSLLAVLSTEMQVDMYDLTKAPPKRTQSLLLDHPPRTIALSPCGSVLAAAYEGGIEVMSLNPNNVPTERRSVKCDSVDALAFSFDGTQILGTTVHSSQPHTVVITAPYYDPGTTHLTNHNISALWTTSILFPNTSRDCSHAVLIQDGKYEEAAWAFTYDRSFETFRAVRIDDLRNGTTYFTGPLPSAHSQAKLLPCTLPAASYHGELVSAGFSGKDVWLYGVPEDLDAVPETVTPSADGSSTASTLLRRHSSRSSRAQQDSDDSARVPQWQLLCDKLRNTFVAGYKITELEGVQTVKFVADFGGSCMKERLIIAARGAVPNVCATEEEGIDFVDGGRITVLDFDYSPHDGGVKEMVIEVGSKEPEVLEEEHRDIDTEVAIVRRRTVAQKKASRARGLAPTTTARPPPLPDNVADDPLVPRRIGVPASQSDTQATDDTEEQSIDEQEALDAPYEHASPRTAPTLRRAATAAARTRRQYQSAAGNHIVYRRADGRPYPPHESDADNWVPPPPPYQKEDPGDLPAFLRGVDIKKLLESMQKGTVGVGGVSELVPVVTPQVTGAVPVATPSVPAPVVPAGAVGGVVMEEQEVMRHPYRHSSASMVPQVRRSNTVAPGTGNNRVSMPAMEGQSVTVVPGPGVPPVPALPALPALPGAVRAPVRQQAQVQAQPQRPTTVTDPRYLNGENIYDSTPPSSPRQQARRVSTLQGQPPALTLQIPGSRGEELPGRRLSVSRTWPIQTTSQSTSYPLSAPPVTAPNQVNSSPAAALTQPRPPAATPTTGEPTAWRRPQSTLSSYRPPPQHQRPASALPLPITTSIAPAEPMPLIISTPKGVQGGFDSAPRPSDDRPGTASGLGINTTTALLERADTPILSPTPRRPRGMAQRRAEFLDGEFGGEVEREQRARAQRRELFPGAQGAQGQCCTGSGGRCADGATTPRTGTASRAGGRRGFFFARRVPSVLSRRGSRRSTAASRRRQATPADNVPPVPPLPPRTIPLLGAGPVQQPSAAVLAGWVNPDGTYVGRDRSTRSQAKLARSVSTKRGKTKKKGKGKKKEREVDVESSVWTDVTGWSVADTMTGTVVGGPRSVMGDGTGMAGVGAQGYAGYGGRKREKEKCVVM